MMRFARKLQGSAACSWRCRFWKQVGGVMAIMGRQEENKATSKR